MKTGWRGDIGRAGGEAAAIVAVKTGIGDAVGTVEREQKIILHHTVRAERGGVERHLPVLVGRGVAVIIQSDIAPTDLRGSFVKQRTAGLVGDLHTVVPFSKAV